MVTPFINYCKSKAKLSLAFIEILKDDARIMAFPPLLNLSETMQENQGIFFVLKGCIRSFVPDEKNEITTDFFQHAEIFGSNARLVSPTDAPCEFQALTQSDVVFLPYSSIEKIYLKCPEANSVAFKILQDKYLHLSRMAALSKFTGATRRYAVFRELVEDTELIPMVYLASFLGMRPETLARVKSRFQIEVGDVN